MKKNLLLALTLLLVAGCATAPEPQRTSRRFRKPQLMVQPTAEVQSDDLNDEAEPLNAALVSPASNDEVSEVLSTAAAETKTEVGESKEQVRNSIMRIKPEDNELVQKWITYFSGRDKERFQRFMDRGEKYRELIEFTLEENELPAELYYLAMIESGFSTHAQSTAKAKGVWQFMPATGKRYGLEVGNQVDERRDPIRATEAASRYLKDLHNVFGSWHLAMAAYNAGETRIMNAVFRGRSRNYWELGKKRVIPLETANYVPKMLAAMIIARDYKRYGFRTPQGEAMQDLDAAEVPSPVRLQAIAAATGLDLAMLEDANPHLLKGHTPINHRTYEVWVPSQKVALVQSRRGQIAQSVFRSRVTVAHAETDEVTRPIHVVKRGENLSLISRKYGISIATLIKTNGLAKSGRVHKGQRLRVTGGREVAGGEVRDSGSDMARAREILASSKNIAGSTASRKNGIGRAPTTTHRVKRGENLNLISRKYGVSVAALKKNNSLRRDTLHVGQVIRVSRN